MSESVVPALPDLDALRAQLDETTLWLIEIIRAMHRAMLTADDGAVTFHELQTIASAVRERLTPVLDYAASLQRERDELRRKVPTPDEVEALECAANYFDAEDILDEDIPYREAGALATPLRALVSRNTTTENEHGI